MAVAFDASASTTSGGSSFPITWTHTPVGTPTAVSVYIVNFDPTVTVSGVTYGGTAMTRSQNQIFGTGSGSMQLWGLANPSAGGQTVSISGTVGSAFLLAASVTVTGSDTTTCFRNTFAQEITSGSSYTGTVSSVVSGDLAVDGNGNLSNFSYTVGTGVTKDWGDISSGAFTGAGGYRAVTGTSVTMGWTLGGTIPGAANDAAQVIGVFQQASAAGPTPYNPWPLLAPVLAQ